MPQQITYPKTPTGSQWDSKKHKTLLWFDRGWNDGTIVREVMESMKPSNSILIFYKNKVAMVDLALFAAEMLGYLTWVFPAGENDILGLSDIIDIASPTRLIVFAKDLKRYERYESKVPIILTPDEVTGVPRP